MKLIKIFLALMILPLLMGFNSTSGEYAIYTADTIAGLNSSYSADGTELIAAAEWTPIGNGTNANLELEEGYTHTLARQIISLIKRPVVAISALGAAVAWTAAMYFFFVRKNR